MAVAIASASLLEAEAHFSPQPLVDRVLRESTSVTAAPKWHGPGHWATVAHHAQILGDETGADPMVTWLFGLLHDSQRLRDTKDPGHPARAAIYARRLYKEGKLPLNRKQFGTLDKAIMEHMDGHRSEDPTIGTCWDADRLHHPRTGTAVDVTKLSTKAGHELAPHVTGAYSPKTILELAPGTASLREARKWGRREGKPTPKREAKKVRRKGMLSDKQMAELRKAAKVSAEKRKARAAHKAGGRKIGRAYAQVRDLPVGSEVRFSDPRHPDLWATVIDHSRTKKGAWRSLVHVHATGEIMQVPHQQVHHVRKPRSRSEARGRLMMARLVAGGRRGELGHLDPSDFERRQASTRQRQVEEALAQVGWTPPAKEGLKAEDLQPEERIRRPWEPKSREEWEAEHPRELYEVEEGLDPGAQIPLFARTERLHTMGTAKEHPAFDPFEASSRYRVGRSSHGEDYAHPRKLHVGDEIRFYREEAPGRSRKPPPLRRRVPKDWRDEPSLVPRKKLERIRAREEAHVRTRIRLREVERGIEREKAQKRAEEATLTWTGRGFAEFHATATPGMADRPSGTGAGRHGIVLANDPAGDAVEVYSPDSRKVERVPYQHVHHMRLLGVSDRLEGARAVPGERGTQLRGKIAADRKRRELIVHEDGLPAFVRTATYRMGIPKRDQRGRIVKKRAYEAVVDEHGQPVIDQKTGEQKRRYLGEVPVHERLQMGFPDGGTTYPSAPDDEQVLSPSTASERRRGETHDAGGVTPYYEFTDSNGELRED
jgi:uncharacterized protein